MIDLENPWSDIFDTHTAITPAERSMIDVIADGLMAAPVHVIADMWSPETVAAELLPLVAMNFSVNLYEGDYWTEDAKRDWIASNYEFLSRRGTIKAVRRALEPSGYRLQEYVRRPQGYYASPDVTPEQWQAYLDLLPEIRLSFGPRKGHGGPYFFAGDFLTSAETTEGFAGPDDGKALLGRYGYMLKDGVKTDLVSVEETTTSETVEFKNRERLTTAGNLPLSWCEGDYSDDDRYVDAPGAPDPQILTFEIDQSYTRDTSDFLVSVLTPGMTPIEGLRPDLDTDIGQAGASFFSDDGGAGVDFCGEDDGRYLLVQRTYLLDPTVPVPEVLGYSYSDNDWVGLTPRTAFVMIDLGLTATYDGTFSDETFAGEGYAVGDDRSHENRACRAVEAARGLADRVLIDFGSKRPIQARDPIGPMTQIGEWVKNTL